MPVMKPRRADSVLMVQRRRLQFAPLFLSFCLAAIVVAVGGTEFLSITKSAFENPVCCIDRTRNPFQPLR
jgi:hypothetical protein